VDKSLYQKSIKVDMGKDIFRIFLRPWIKLRGNALRG